jgi:hypothetical protein
MDDLNSILRHIREHPEGSDAWLALSGWLEVNGCGDEAAAVRTFYPAMQKDDRGVVEAAISLVTRHADDHRPTSRSG